MDTTDDLTHGYTSNITDSEEMVAMTVPPIQHRHRQ